MATLTVIQFPVAIANLYSECLVVIDKDHRARIKHLGVISYYCRESGENGIWLLASENGISGGVFSFLNFLKIFHSNNKSFLYELQPDFPATCINATDQHES